MVALISSISYDVELSSLRCPKLQTNFSEIIFDWEFFLVQVKNKSQNIGFSFSINKEKNKCKKSGKYFLGLNYLFMTHFTKGYHTSNVFSIKLLIF